MSKILLIVLGGALGTLSRYWLHTIFSAHFPTFPVGTMLINVTGCFVIGVFAALMPHSEWRDFLIIGFCGGYTTFSSFGLETLKLITDKQWLLAAINVIGSNVLGLLAVYLGWICGQMFQKSAS